MLFIHDKIRVKCLYLEPRPHCCDSKFGVRFTEGLGSETRECVMKEVKSDRQGNLSDNLEGINTSRLKFNLLLLKKTFIKEFREGK